jgi:hypothetical protein
MTPARTPSGSSTSWPQYVVKQSCSFHGGSKEGRVVPNLSPMVHPNDLTSLACPQQHHQLEPSLQHEPLGDTHIHVITHNIHGTNKNLSCHLCLTGHQGLHSPHIGSSYRIKHLQSDTLPQQGEKSVFIKYTFLTKNSEGLESTGILGRELEFSSLHLPQVAHMCTCEYSHVDAYT